MYKHVRKCKFTITTYNPVHHIGRFHDVAEPGRLSFRSHSLMTSLRSVCKLHNKMWTPCTFAGKAGLNFVRLIDGQPFLYLSLKEKGELKWLHSGAVFMSTGWPPFRCRFRKKWLHFYKVEPFFQMVPLWSRFGSTFFSSAGNVWLG